MSKFKFSQRLHYKFDNIMSRGAAALIGWLGIASLLLIVIASFIVVVGHIHPADTPEDMGFIEATWQSLMRAIDSGTIGGDIGWGYRIVMLGVTVGGIFVVSILIGVITSGIESRLDTMRKGRSFVIEKGHTLLLGWSNKIVPIISELIVANENQKNPSVVILAGKDKVEMEDEIREKIPNLKNTRVICRSGSPLDLTDLQIVNPNDAKSIIILAPEDNNPDIDVIKTVLAITNSPKRKTGKYHIVAEIKDEKNLEVGSIVGGEEAVLLLGEDLISRITVQTCRQSGLSVIYTELLDYGGDEIYFSREPKLIGKTYKDAIYSYEDSAIMGIKQGDGEVLINPPMDTVLTDGAEVIAVSEDDDTVRHSGKTSFGTIEDTIVNPVPAGQKPERTLIIGWNQSGDSIVTELDTYVAPGSEVVIVADTPFVENELNNINHRIGNQKITHIRGNTTSRDMLESLDLPSYDHIIVLCYSRIYDMQKSDAMTLITLLHLRDISQKLGTTFNIVSEMQDIGNKELAEVTKANDFIVSDRLISLMLAQLSESRDLKDVFDQLLNAEGSEIYLKPVTDYVKTGVEMDFYTVLESAARKGQTALGYRKSEHFDSPEHAYGVNLNPVKSKKITFNERDKVIVLAED
ncbi:MAG: NAD-binding protein [Ignavibacteriae bacterium]|nr:NAD-binding protein [Ignavibacteriota bacterium]MCB9243489.1 NAD-binding protein [Ignavibacteriales bacterium]